MGSKCSLNKPKNLGKYGQMNKLRNSIRSLGPGLLYAGAAVGVSHLIQSTRAGADFGFQLLLVLILVNIVKYPFFEMGSRYAAATGESLVPDKGFEEQQKEGGLF